MKRCTVRLGLSLMLAMGWWVQRLPAQAPIAPAPAAPASAPCCASSQNPPADGQQLHQGLRRLLNRHGLCCQGSHDSPTCGSLHSELTFIFGSCRQFFGEPCLVPPRHNPVPVVPVYGH
jgi:hypothetical protein